MLGNKIILHPADDLWSSSSRDPPQAPGAIMSQDVGQFRELPIISGDYATDEFKLCSVLNGVWVGK